MASVNLITLDRLAPDELPLERQLNEALVRELVITARGGSSGLMLATVACWALVGRWAGTLVSVLFVVLLGTAVLRLVGSTWLLRGHLQRFPHMHVFGWITAIYAVTGATLSGIVLASWPHLPQSSALLLLVVMIAVNSTAVVTLAASRVAYGLYVLPIWCSCIYLSIAYPIPGLELAVRLMTPVYGAVMLVSCRNVHRSLRNNIVLRLRLCASFEHLRDTQARLVEASRQAGRSDVATAVLHNVGNVLNSVNISAVLVNDIVGGMRIAKLSQIAAMITEHGADLAGFFRDDPRGQKLPAYFSQLQAALERDKAAAAGELSSLMRNVDHIKVIVSSQQSHVRVGGVVETFDARDLLDDALKFSASSGERDTIEIVRRFEPLPPVNLDRHKVLQIVLNLLTNARDAVLSQPAGERRIIVSTRAGDNASLEIAVEDNGCGVDPANLDRIFHLGFTTKPSGNGLGLHYSACAARELHGNLTARSAGVGRGASFLLVLPLDAMAAR